MKQDLGSSVYRIIFTAKCTKLYKLNKAQNLVETLIPLLQTGQLGQAQILKYNTVPGSKLIWSYKQVWKSYIYTKSNVQLFPWTYF